MKSTYRRIVCVAFAALAFLALSADAANAQVERTTPRPEVVRLAQALIDTVNGNAAAVDKFVKEHFTTEYQAARPAEERRKWFESVRAKYGKVTLSSLQRTEPDTFTIVARGEKDEEVRFAVTHNDSLKVMELGLEQAGGR